MTATVELHALGDIMLFGRYDQLAETREASRLFDRVTPLWTAADVVVGNLECVLSDLGEPLSGKLCLRGKPEYRPILAQSGITVLSLANNHAFDFGAEAFKDMRDDLEAAGLTTVGAGETLTAARTPRIVERNGLRLGFLAYCHASTRNLSYADHNQSGVAPLELELVYADIAALKDAVDHIILSLHWGLEYSGLPTPEQVQLARSAIDRGARVVIGHHSHMLQGIETYRDGVIAYSLANFIDADVDLEQHGKVYRYQMVDVDRESILLRVKLSPGQVELLEPVPLWLADDGMPEPATGDRRDKILRDLAERSASLAADDLKGAWENRLVEKRVAGPLLHWWRNGNLVDKIRNFRLGQLKTAYLLIRTYLKIRFSRSEERWGLFNPRNDTEPMPYAEDASESSVEPAKQAGTPSEKPR